MLARFLPILAAAFVVLKLLGIQPIAEWSWWWVTAPLWGGFLLIFAVLLGPAIQTEMEKQKRRIGR